MGLHTARGVPSAKVLPGIIPFVPNSTQPFPIQTNSVIEEIHFQLTGTLVLAGYTAPPTVRLNGLENLVRSVRFTGNAKVSGAQSVSFSNVNARFLHMKTAMVNGTWPDRVDVGSANGTYQFETNFTKFFSAKRVKLPGGSDITALDTRKLQSLVVNIDWRDATALVHGGTGGTATLSNVQIVVSVEERYVQGMQKGAPYIKETMRTIPLGPIGSGIDRDIPNIPRSNFLLRQYLTGLVGDVDYAEPSDAFFTTTLKPEGAHLKTIITGQSGSLTRFDVAYDQQVTTDRHDFKLEDWPDGVVVLEYSPTGIPKDFLDLRTGSPTFILDAKNQLDLTLVGGQTNTLEIVDEEFVLNN